MENKMTPTPWFNRLYDNGDGKHSQVIYEREWTTKIALLTEKDHWITPEINNANAAAIVSAINNTYGKGIDPSSVPELVDFLKGLIDKEEKAYEGRRRSADHFNNNADGVGIKFDYETPDAMPKWVHEAKSILAKSIIKQ